MAEYSLDPISANCYPETTVLINKLNIRDNAVLAQIEADLTQEAAIRWVHSPTHKLFDFTHYKAIHRHLFQDLYDWAGEVREVNISKKGTRFCPTEEIHDYAERVFSHLRGLDYLMGLPIQEFMSEFVDFYIATNYLHPFREGNGRTQRIFLTQLADNAGYVLNFADIDVDELMIATIQSAHGVIDGLTSILSKAISPSLDEQDKIKIEPVKRKETLSSKLARAQKKADKYDAVRKDAAYPIKKDHSR